MPTGNFLVCFDGISGGLSRPSSYFSETVEPLGPSVLNEVAMCKV